MRRWTDIAGLSPKRAFRPPGALGVSFLQTAHLRQRLSPLEVFRSVFKSVRKIVRGVRNRTTAWQAVSGKINQFSDNVRGADGTAKEPLYRSNHWLGAGGLDCDGAAVSGSAGLLGAFSVAGGAWWWWYGYGGGGTGDGAKASPMMVAAKTGGNTSASNAGANDDGDAMRPVRDCPQ